MTTIAPVMTKRDEPLGWLASTPTDYPLRFAVAGETEAVATETFQAALLRWESLPDS
jgi:hypothetical protein